MLVAVRCAWLYLALDKRSEHVYFYGELGTRCVLQSPSVEAFNTQKKRQTFYILLVLSRSPGNIESVLVTISF